MAKFTFAPSYDPFTGLTTPAYEVDDVSDTPEEPGSFKFASWPNPTGIGSGPVTSYKAPRRSLDPFGDGSDVSIDPAFIFAAIGKASTGADPSGDGSAAAVKAVTFCDPFGDDLGTAAAGGIVKSHDKHDDCDCGGDCSDCSAKAAKLYFSPGTRIRHKLTGKIYTMVSTTCVSPDDCVCILRKSDGSEFEAMYLPDEVERVA